ncbi:MAG TPA: HAD family hydrolase [Ktedonobacteraceae bacterium]
MFDLGSTLWTSKDERVIQVHERIANLHAVLELFRFCGTGIYSEMDVDELGRLLRKSFEKQIRVRTRQLVEFEPDFTQATMDALQQIGLPDVTRELGEAIYEALRVRTPDIRVLFEDTLSTLAALKERDYLLGVVSNRHFGGAPFHEDLREMGLLDYIELRHMAISADLGIRKPNPDIFLRALNSLNTLPEEAVMVGDSLRGDITGAKRLNILSIWIPKTSLRADALAAMRASGQAQQGALTDDYLLAYTRQIEKRGRQTPDTIKPDIIIECLSDLLDMF